MSASSSGDVDLVVSSPLAIDVIVSWLVLRSRFQLFYSIQKFMAFIQYTHVDNSSLKSRIRKIFKESLLFEKEKDENAKKDVISMKSHDEKEGEFSDD